ncbi:MAG: hypothetical protein K0B11_12430, partial [Mariniphaga sp.]|nr:hypothetical protein [Mariniphaga sp.]
MNFKILTTKTLLLIIALIFTAVVILNSCKPDPIEIPNNPPVVNVSASPIEGTVPLGSRIKVDGTDEDGKSDIASYSLEIKELGINFSKPQPIDTLLTFSNPGEYNVKGTVRDKSGDSDSKNINLKFSKDTTPENNIPVANVSATPLEGEAPFESRIKVDGTDEDGIEDIKKYFLSIEGLGLDVMKSSPIDTNIVFSNSGEYNVRGIVEDSKGARDTLEVLVSVNEPENNIPVANVSASPSQGEAPFESRIKVDGTDEDGIEDIKKYFLSIEGLGLDVMK